MLVFFFNDTATTEIYTLSLHDALPISTSVSCRHHRPADRSHASSAALPRSHRGHRPSQRECVARAAPRSEEHTSELQSRQYLVCRLLLEKKKKLGTLLLISYLLVN